MSGGAQKIGRDGLRQLVDQLNAMRAQHGFPERYATADVAGVLTMTGPHGSSQTSFTRGLGA